MNIATVLADSTHSLEACRKIPGYLAKVLELEPITLAIVGTAKVEDPAIVLLASSGIAADVAGGATLSHEVLEIHRLMHRPLGREGPSLRLVGEGGEEDVNFSELEIPATALGSRALVFGRVIDASHRLLLIVHRCGNQPRLSETLMDTVAMIAGHLAKLFQTMPECAAEPAFLGAPFDRLTGREWGVLRGLNSDDGEKQLADRLGLSPHTLHSHIKSIYRKIGVQGRLSLLVRFQEATRDLRKKTMASPLGLAAEQHGERVVAAG